MVFNPQYTLSAEMKADLDLIESARVHMSELPITAKMLASLRETTRITSTHHSTAIEGNQLSLDEVEEALRGKHFPHREKDEKEVLDYYKALNYIEQCALEPPPLTEKDIQLLHGLSFLGRKKPTPYRDGQNVIRAGRLVVYIPPKSHDVPSLMQELLDWINLNISKGLALPIVAALAHYQFATIHPYFDGNGRTARLLVTLILHKNNYGLNGVYSLEEYYAKDLAGYYEALTVGDDEDYYEGKRTEADLSTFLAYFLKGMAIAFQKVLQQGDAAQSRGETDQSIPLRELSHEQKQILSVFIRQKEITTKDVASFFQINERRARLLCHKWLKTDFLELANPAPKTRSYQLTAHYENLVQNKFKADRD